MAVVVAQPGAQVLCWVLVQAWRVLQVVQEPLRQLTEMVAVAVAVVAELMMTWQVVRAERDLHLLEIIMQQVTVDPVAVAAVTKTMLTALTLA